MRNRTLFGSSGKLWIIWLSLTIWACSSTPVPYRFSSDELKLVPIQALDTLTLLGNSPVELVNFIEIAVSLKTDTLSEVRLRGSLLLDCIARNVKSGIDSLLYNPDDASIIKVLGILESHQYHIYQPTPSGLDKFIHYLNEGEPSDYCHIFQALNSRVLKLHDIGLYLPLLILILLIWVWLLVRLRKLEKHVLFIVGVVVSLSGILIATLIHFPDFTCSLILP